MNFVAIQWNLSVKRVSVLFLAVWCAFGSVSGDDSVAPQSEQALAQSLPTLTVERIEQLTRQMEQDPGLTTEAKAAIGECYRAALTDLKTCHDLAVRLGTLTADSESAKARAEKLKTELEDLKSKQPDFPQQLSLAELEQLHSQLEIQLAAQKQARTSAETELQARSQRRKDARARSVTIAQRLDALKTQTAAHAATESTPISIARGIQLSAQRRALESDLPVLEAELAKYDAEDSAGIVRLKTDVLARQISFTEKSIEQLQTRIKSAREQAAAASVRKARIEAIQADPALKAFADENSQLAEKAKATAESLAVAERDLKAAEEVYEKLIRHFDQTRQKVDSVGLTSSVGSLLRKQRSMLPDVSQRRHSVALRQSLINDTQYEMFENEDARRAVGDSDQAVMDMVREGENAKPNEVLESAAQELLSRKREYLDAVIRNGNQYFDTLIELDTTERQLIKLAADYENYIDQRVLWIRSSRPLTTDFTIDESDSWLLESEKWGEVGSALKADAIRRFPLYLLAAGLICTLIWRGQRMRCRISEAGTVAQKANCRSILPTLTTMTVTAILSATWPVLCVFIGWRLNRVPTDSEFVSAVSRGLISASMVWFVIEFIRQICRANGLAPSHFRWSDNVTQTIRKELRRFGFLIIPLVFVTGALAGLGPIHGRDAIERVCYAMGMICVAIAVVRLLRSDGLPRGYMNSHPDGWLARFKHVWPLAAAVLPLGLGTLAVAGYHYTASILFWRVFATTVFMIGLVLLRALFLRMLMLRRRSLSIEQSRQRAAQCAAQASEHSDQENHNVAGIVTSDPESDITTQSLQSRRLVNTALAATSVLGLWFIWVQVLPALGMLDKYPVWGDRAAQTVSVTESKTISPSSMLTPGVDSSSSEGASEAAEPVQNGSSSVVTVSDLALAILITFVTVVLARNGPGLLEMSVLQQLPVDASIRYAITTLVSYAIILIGTIATCSTIGLQWSQIQWLATALTFGLAFGLQEMFANFVAGLIILLERPIRVGDVVTVDDITGVVSKIRIRATSITNWDRKEYVVPNKEFITGRLLNWTLSDKVNRIVIEIGLAYGSDTERARELLLEAANNHPMILKDPPSVATFEGFGDNALNLVLRTYLPSLDNRLEVIHQLHTSIDLAFRQAGLEIAFPQRDLHVRSLPKALGIALSGEQRSESQQEIPSDHRGAA